MHKLLQQFAASTLKYEKFQNRTTQDYQILNVKCASFASLRWGVNCHVPISCRFLSALGVVLPKAIQFASNLWVASKAHGMQMGPATTDSFVSFTNLSKPLKHTQLWFVSLWFQSSVTCPRVCITQCHTLIWGPQVCLTVPLSGTGLHLAFTATLYSIFLVPVTEVLQLSFKDIAEIRSDNEKMISMRGELTEEQRRLFERRKKHLQKYHAAALSLAEMVDQKARIPPIPELTLTTNTNNQNIYFTSYSMAAASSEEAPYDLNNPLPLFDDEESRAFYEDFPEDLAQVSVSSHVGLCIRSLVPLFGDLCGLRTAGVLNRYGWSMAIGGDVENLVESERGHDLEGHLLGRQASRRTQQPKHRPFKQWLWVSVGCLPTTRHQE